MSIRLTGPLYGHIEGGRSVAGYPTPGGAVVGETGYEHDVFASAPDPQSPGADLRFHYDDGDYTSFLTVTDPGPAFITVESVRTSGGGIWGGSDEIKGRAIFVVSAPVGTQFRLEGTAGQRLSDLRLDIDRDGDGAYDDEQEPDMIVTGDDLDSYRQFQTIATVNDRGSNEAHVSLSTQGVDAVDRTYYWTFPGEPRPRLYDTPLVITEPSYVLFASLDRDGNLEVVQEARVLGGAPEIVGAVDLDEEHVISFREPGQIAKLTFRGSKGQRVVPEVTAARLGPFPCCSGRMQVLGPDGSAIVGETGIGLVPSAMRTLILPGDGVYTLLVNPYLAYTGDVTVVVDALDDVTASVRADEPPLSLTFEHAKQRGLVTFEGRACQQVSVVVERPESSRCCSAEVKILSPSGETLVSDRVRLAYQDVVTLRVDPPVDGLYTIALDPWVDRPGSLTVAVNNLSDVERAVTLNDPITTLRIDTPGQDARLTFSGAAGQQVYVSAFDRVAADTGLGVTYGDRRTRLSVLDATRGGEIARAWLIPRGETVLAVTLPADGRYIVVLDPPDATVGTLEVGLHDTAPASPALSAAPLAVDGPPSTLVIDTVDTLAQRSFNGVEGQLISLSVGVVTGAESGDCCTFWPHLYGPDGMEPSFMLGIDLGLFGEDGMTRQIRIPASGVYVIEVQSYETATGSFNMALTSVADIATTLTVGGPPVTLETTEPGQFARVAFTGRAGTVIVSVTMAEQGRETDWILNYSLPGAEHSKGWGSVSVQPGWSNSERFTLPADGEYTLLFKPSGVKTFSVSLAVSLPPEALPTPEVAPTSVTVDGAPVAVTVSHNRGQPETMLTFVGTAGQQLRVEAEISHHLISAYYCCGYDLVVEDANGIELGSSEKHNGTLQVDVTLPTSGEYVIRLRALGTSSGQLLVSAREVN